MLSLANRGYNLWAIDKYLLPTTENKATYVMPDGTIDVLNVIYSQPTIVTGTDSTTATTFETLLDSPTTILRVGVAFSALPTTSYTIDSSDDGATWTTRQTVALADFPATGETVWYDLDPTVEADYWRVSGNSAITVDEFYLCSEITDITVTQWNRDEYVQQPTKTSTGRPSTNYYYEKKLTPQVTLWPVPNSSTDQLSVWVHRQIQDIGSLTQQIEVPQRWLEPMTWQLAARLAFELPGVDPARLGAVMQMADKYLIEGEMDESDGAPSYIAPGIGVYTR
jgi:hypothetical protein